jgi:hypothetical protein
MEFVRFVTTFHTKTYDQRVKDWLGMSSPLPTIAVSLTYVFIVKVKFKVLLNVFIVSHQYVYHCINHCDYHFTVSWTKVDGKPQTFPVAKNHHRLQLFPNTSEPETVLSCLHFWMADNWRSRLQLAMSKY